MWYYGCLVGGLRAMGQSLIPMIASIIGVCGGRMFWIFVIFEHFKYSQGIDVLGFHLTPLQILMFAWPFAWIVTLIFHLITLIYEFRKNKKKDEAINKINVINH